MVMRHYKYLMKLKKNHLILLLALFVICVMTVFLFRDLNLDLDQLRESLENRPVIVMENLEFEREVSGELWRVRTPVAERRHDIVEFRSIDVLRRLANGKEWFFMGLHGLYSETTESADVTGVTGTMETDTRVLNLESPFLSWTMYRNEFVFPRGLIVYDEEFLLEANLASLDESGIMALNEGAVIRWRRIVE